MAIGRRELWFSLFVLVVFALGLATGLTTGRYLRRGPPPGRPGPPGPPPSAAAMAERMSTELGLDGSQRQKVEEAFRAGADRLDRFRASTREQFDALDKQLTDDIERVLTSDQLDRFRKIRAEQRRRGPGRGPGPGFGPGPGPGPGGPPPGPPPDDRHGPPPPPRGRGSGDGGQPPPDSAPGGRE